MSRNLEAIHSRFPFKDGSYRQNQKETIEQLFDLLDDEKVKFVALQQATGTGKSVIEYMIAQGFDRTIITTPQITLQEQFVNSFKRNNDIGMVCAANNYDCVNVPDKTCAIGICRRSGADDLLKSTCPFHNAKSEALIKKIAVVNPQYLLNEINCGVAGSAKFAGNPDGSNKPDLLIIDEAHLLEEAIRSFCTLKINASTNEKLNITREVPILTLKNDEYDFKQIINFAKYSAYELTDQMGKLKKDYDKIVKKHPHELSDMEFSTLQFYHDLDSYYKSFERFLTDINVHQKNWIYTQNDSTYEIQLQPIELFGLASKYLFTLTQKVLFVSATILDEKLFANSLGIQNISFLRVPSIFDKSKHQVNYMPLGHFNYKNIIESIEVISGALELILEQHRGQKGIIHLPSFSVGELLKTYYTTKKKEHVLKRLLFHTSKDRIDVLEKHIESTEDTVLVSPSFYEGVDLKDDLSRFQVFTKVPYPNLGDKLVKTKFDRNKQYYQWKTVLKLVQGAGRSIRGENDWATSYILDGNFERLYTQNKKYFNSIDFHFSKI